MARIHEPTPEQIAGYHKWIASRPENVRRVAQRFDPWSLYRLKDSGHRVTVYCFNEHDNGTVTLQIDVTAEYNAVMFERRVFGVDPDNLEPCDLPGPDEPLGAMLNAEEVDENIDVIRAMAGITKVRQ